MVLIDKYTTNEGLKSLKCFAIELFFCAIELQQFSHCAINTHLKRRITCL